MSHHHCSRLGVTSFGFAVGIVWALGLLILALFSWWTDWGRFMVSVISSVYVGYAPTFWGTIVGVILGFIDGFISGVILAAIYNCCVRKCKKSDLEGVETHV
ncbi:bacteriophage holin [Coxiella endosymbiont of Ornithodoros maritimus]|uniref:bacteriophage holin n=1 Tax=Coxiella endosymbiont of Ornithodoros maritimus TaxID=1656172 RepID=UPI0022653891|nr:bacteriophage holin [Coxiella endosymbiont of Ornithodoros maritimus]